MAPMINPFDAGGYPLAEMTTAINILPNMYTRLGQMGLFRFEGVTQRSVIIEQADGVLNLLPTVPLGGSATVANRDSRSMRSFTVPWIPHVDGMWLHMLFAREARRESASGHSGRFRGVQVTPAYTPRAAAERTS
jgi:Phage major capsid protein E